MAQTGENLSAVRETWVQFLGREDPLEKGMATPQYSCLENPHGWRRLQAAVHEVAKSQTQLSR